MEIPLTADEKSKEKDFLLKEFKEARKYFFELMLPITLPLLFSYGLLNPGSRKLSLGVLYLLKCCHMGCKRIGSSATILF